MSAGRIVPVTMPKWGLSMKEGKLAGWLAEVGKTLTPGEAILEVETDKIAGNVEVAQGGVLRRRVGMPDTVYPVKALLGVIADPSVSDAEIDAFVAAYVTPPAEEEGGEEGRKYEFVDTSAGKIRYARRGSGTETIVLIHGFGGDLDNWLFNIDALAESATVHAIDLPGHGQSAKTAANPSIGMMVKTVAEFMDALSIGAAHFVGHSMGGAIAMILAAERPAAVKSLTLVCPAGMGAEIGPYVEDFVAAQGRKDLKAALEQLFADKNLVSRKLVDDVLKYKRLDGVETFLKTLSGSLRQQSTPAKTLSAGNPPPTLVLWGKEDRVIPPSHAHAIPTASVHILDGAGHMVFMEKANEVNALIKAHIAA